MTEKMKNILIGLFVATSVTIVIAMILFLEPKVGDGKKHFHVRFTNIAGIAVGTRVAFAGKPVGEVVHIREVDDARDHPDDAGRIYCYELTLKTDSSLEIYETDEIAIRSIGLMGEKSINILPKAGKSAAPVPESQTLYASAVDPLENTLNQMTKVATRIDGTVEHVDTWFQQNSPLVTQNLQALHQATSRVDSTLATLEENQIIPAIRGTVDLMNDNLHYLRSSFVDDQLLHKIACLAEHLDQVASNFNADGAQILRNLNQTTKDLSSGVGTLGRLINRDDFYLHLSSLMSKAETLMNDINHYGILFQYDKKWQRSRTKKANLLKSLDSPKEFRAYFEGEVDGITSSLGRLSELLERAGDSEEKSKIADNEHFKTQFASLLRHAESLTDIIKLYNQGLVEQKNTAE